MSDVDPRRFDAMSDAIGRNQIRLKALEEKYDDMKRIYGQRLDMHVDRLKALEVSFSGAGTYLHLPEELPVWSVWKR